MMRGGSLSTFAFSVYNVKILQVLFAKIPTSSLFDTSRLLRVKLFVGQCQQWLCCVIVLQHFPSMPVFKRSNCACRIKCGRHPSASRTDWDGTADCLAPLVWGACQMAGLPPLAFPMQEETRYQHKTDGWRGECVWLDYIIRSMCMGMTIHDCCCIVRFVSPAWGALWNRAQNIFTLGLCCCLVCKPLL